MELKKVLPAPLRHANIPENSIWHSGEGAGSWFYISSDLNEVYSIMRYSEKGEVECSGFFTSNYKIEDHWPNNINVAYPSNCKILNIVVDGRLLKFEIKRK